MLGIYKWFTKSVTGIIIFFYFVVPIIYESSNCNQIIYLVLAIVILIVILYRYKQKHVLEETKKEFFCSGIYLVIGVCLLYFLLYIIEDFFDFIIGIPTCLISISFFPLLRFEMKQKDK